MEIGKIKQKIYIFFTILSYVEHFFWRGGGGGGGVESQNL